MNLKDIIAISGQKGLFKFIKDGRNGIIVESLEDHKRMNAYATSKISSLEDISIFLEEGEIKLGEVFKKINEKENGGLAINPKSTDEELKNYLAALLPDYSRDKVYASDIKKMVSWYNTLHNLNMLDFTEEVKEEAKEEKETDSKPTEKPEEQPAQDQAEKPVKKTSKKK